jgi:hypothetical protein
VREREYPRDGADSFGALPDNAIVYAEGLPKSKLGKDPLYVTGDPNGVIPEEPKPIAMSEEEPLHDGEEPPAETKSDEQPTSEERV